MLPLGSQAHCTLSVAGLRLELDAREKRVQIRLPPTHAPFVTAGVQSDLRLAVRLGRLQEVAGWRPVCASYPTWQLWRDRSGCLVFVVGERSRPGRQVRVDAGFRHGEVLVEPDGPAEGNASLYPLAGLDIILFANWLAGSGDLILHASGVEFEGRGYCFAGESGAGKSTMVAGFAGCPGVTLLGEDNLVLRCIDRRFWVFGTPWHLDPAGCSPHGAPLDKLFFLDRTVATGIHPCSPRNGAERLLQTAFVPYYRRDLVDRLLENLAHLAEQVAFDILSHRPGSDVMELLSKA